LSELPRLETLTIASNAITAEGILEFRKRSAATLKISPHQTVSDEVKAACAKFANREQDSINDHMTLDELGLGGIERQELIAAIKLAHFDQVMNFRRGREFAARASSRSQITVGELTELLRTMIGR
jgi:hypothetical protein